MPLSYEFSLLVRHNSIQPNFTVLLLLSVCQNSKLLMTTVTRNQRTAMQNTVKDITEIKRGNLALATLKMLNKFLFSAKD